MNGKKLYQIITSFSKLVWQYWLTLHFSVVTINIVVSTRSARFGSSFYVSITAKTNWLPQFRDNNYTPSYYLSSITTAVFQIHAANYSYHFCNCQICLLSTLVYTVLNFAQSCIKFFIMYYQSSTANNSYVLANVLYIHNL